LIVFRLAVLPLHPDLKLSRTFAWIALLPGNRCVGRRLGDHRSSASKIFAAASTSVSPSSPLSMRPLFPSALLHQQLFLLLTAVASLNLGHWCDQNSFFERAEVMRLQ